MGPGVRLLLSVGGVGVVTLLRWPVETLPRAAGGTEVRAVFPVG